MNVEYDRELIASMLDSVLAAGEFGHSTGYTRHSMNQQAELLRDADNRDAAGVHTATTPQNPTPAASGVDARILAALKNYLAQCEREHVARTDQSELAELIEALAAQPAPGVGGELSELAAQWWSESQECDANNIQAAATLRDRHRPCYIAEQCVRRRCAPTAVDPRPPSVPKMAGKPDASSRCSDN
jgi:hypothetical protein